MSKDKRPEEKRHFTHGAGGALADAAPEGEVSRDDHHPDSPHARRADKLRPNEKPDQLAGKAEASEARGEDRKEARIDESVEETFPASDPPSAHHIT